MGYLTFTPFEGLGKKIKKLRRDKILNEGSLTRDSAVKSQFMLDSLEVFENEKELMMFLREMKGVVPLKKEESKVEVSFLNQSKRHPTLDHSQTEEEVLKKLKELVSGNGFISLKDTSEFVSGGRSSFSSVVADALHNGRFSVQAYLDLHGVDVVTALALCEEFVADSIKKDLRCIAFIHGRGLGSKDGPVLKKAVVDWLTRGPYRRFLVAYASAPPWDGGTGVTYCLLKRFPYKKRKNG